MSDDILAHLDKLTAATEIEFAWRLHCDFLAQQYGFDRILYVSTRFATKNGIGDINDFTILTNHERSYVDGYVGRGLYLHSPIVHWSRTHSGAVSWDWMNQDPASLSPHQRDVLDFNKRHRVTAGYSIVFSDPSFRNVAGVALAARADYSQEDVERIWRAHGDRIELINRIAHLKLMQLPYAAPSRSLTKRQRQTLECVRDGKTNQEIAEIMSLSLATIEKHLRMSRETLGVETTAQAVLKASFQNQLFVVESE